LLKLKRQQGAKATTKSGSPREVGGLQPQGLEKFPKSRQEEISRSYYSAWLNADP
jgi:hypothetical protein